MTVEGSHQPEEPQWLAKPPGDCCLKGHMHEGTPAGKFVQVDGIDTYIAEPSASNANGNIVLYYPDVYGMFTNALLVMDEFAQAGILSLEWTITRDPVWMHQVQPHSFEGFDYSAFLERHTKFADARVPGWIDTVKAQYGKPGTKYACVGYCFGAPYVCKSLTPRGDDPAVCQVGAFAHPAFLKESHFENLVNPIMLSCAEADITFETPSRRRAIDILVARERRFNLQLFSGVEHGFALRADLTDPYAAWVKQQSLSGIVAWFNLHLGKSS